MVDALIHIYSTVAGICYFALMYAFVQHARVNPEYRGAQMFLGFSLASTLDALLWLPTLVAVWRSKDQPG